jgi:hypothetical protein
MAYCVNILRADILGALLEWVSGWVGKEEDTRKFHLLDILLRLGCENNPVRIVGKRTCK